MSYYSQLSHYFSLDLSTHKEYLGEIETFLESQGIAQRATCKDALDEAWDVRLTAMEHLYPDILRKSFFLTLYALAEVELKNICRHVEEQDKLPLSLDDLFVQGGFTEKIRKYLERLARVRVPHTPEWAELENYRKLRNCVTHTQGALTSSKDDRYLGTRYIPSQSPLLSIYDDTVIFNRGFCERVIDILGSSVSQLCTVLDNRQLDKTGNIAPNPRRG